MSGWTPERSTLLSMLLDEVTGTPEMIEIRKDFCRLRDCIASCKCWSNAYFTGSKAEGLNLPGSDEDYMFDINNGYHVQVTQSVQVEPNINSYLLFLNTENTNPCFATLRFMDQIIHPELITISRNIDGLPHLSSDLLMKKQMSFDQMFVQDCEKVVRQGPSMEYWNPFCNRSESGEDHVLSIHCPFWPNGAMEWIYRQRHFDWPTQRDMSSIVNFGCHLVPIGDPRSLLNDMEWRISFSIAERILVWSFNHIQMQCYAVMKIMLKEFIKVRCNPRSQILCSYFIKTFLFWEFESNDLNFWRRDNFRECITYLLTKFFTRLREGVIRHYFFPRFNLLSIKLTREAQTELLQVLDIAIQSDISIIKECRTLRGTWAKYIVTNDNIDNIMDNAYKTNVILNDECMMQKLNLLYQNLPDNIIPIANYMGILPKICNTSSKTQLKSLTIKSFIFLTKVRQPRSLQCQGNKEVYTLHREANSMIPSFDLSTCKCWFALLLLKKGDYRSCLRTVNMMLSRISPFAMFMSDTYNQSSHETMALYVDRFSCLDVPILSKANTAWLFNLYFYPDDAEILPVAIRTELQFIDFRHSVQLSPFVFAYYLMFLCYHELHQYGNRNRALSKLVDVVKDPHRHGNIFYHSINIARHCLLQVGETTLARKIFIASHKVTLDNPAYEKYNSALYYLESMSK